MSGIDGRSRQVHQVQGLPVSLVTNSGGTVTKAKDLEEPTHGECPFCHRVYRFRLLLRHMKRKHPGWVLQRPAT